MVESDLPLDAAQSEAAPDWTVLRGEAHSAREAPRGRVLSALSVPGAAYDLREDPRDPALWTLRYEGVCAFEIDRGRKSVVAYPEPGVDDEMCSLLLAGNVLAHLLSAAGELMLHASAVAVGGKALATIGTSGGGKSTLAAWLHRAGAEVVSDDALRVDIDGGAAYCHAGTRTLRLRRSSTPLAESGSSSAARQTVDGRLALRAPQPSASRFRLAAVLVPMQSREAEVPEIERLTKRDALLELLRYPRVIGWQDAEVLRVAFVRAGRLAELVPVFKATVPWGPPFPRPLAEQLLRATGIAALPEGAIAG